MLRQLESRQGPVLSVVRPAATPDELSARRPPPVRKLTKSVSTAANSSWQPVAVRFATKALGSLLDPLKIQAPQQVGRCLRTSESSANNLCQLLCGWDVIHDVLHVSRGFVQFLRFHAKSGLLTAQSPCSKDLSVFGSTPAQAAGLELL